MTVAYSDAKAENFLVPVLRNPSTRTALAEYRTAHFSTPLLTIDDMLHLPQEKQTTHYIGKVITSRLAHHLAVTGMLDGAAIYGDTLAQHKDGAVLGNSLYLKLRRRPGLILMGAHWNDPTDVRPLLRLDSLLENKKDDLFAVKSGTDPVTEERMNAIITGMMRLRTLLNKRSYTLVLLETPEAQIDTTYTYALRKEFRHLNIKLTLDQLPETTHKIHDVADRALEHYRACSSITIGSQQVGELVEGPWTKKE